MVQDYSAYTEDDFKVWQLLFDRQMETLPELASIAYLDGIQSIGFNRNEIPKFEWVDQVLREHTGWRLEVVPGLIPNKPFFELLRDKRFPATTWFRRLDQLDYLEEPDMFHDVFGHVPLLTNQHFTGFLSELSKIALKHIDNEWAIELISRLYWYTVEFGLIREGSALKIYGSGILSSNGESVYSVSDKPVHAQYDVTEILRSSYIKDKFQPKYWIIDSYQQLYSSIPEIEMLLDSELKHPVN